MAKKPNSGITKLSPLTQVRPITHSNLPTVADVFATCVNFDKPDYNMNKSLLPRVPQDVAIRIPEGNGVPRRSK